MSNALPGNRIEIADLMEASFWEANKLRIGLIVGVVALAILGWVAWAGRVDANEAAGWGSIVNERFDMRRDIELTDALKKSSAGPWAEYLAARNAFDAGKFDEAIRLLDELKGSPRYAVVNRDQRVDHLLEDAKSELAFKAANPPKKDAATYPEDRILTVHTDAGDMKIGVASDMLPTLASRLLALSRNGSLAKTGFTEALSGESMTATIEPENATDADPAKIQWTEAEAARARVGRPLPHGKGAVTLEFIAAKTPDADSTKTSDEKSTKGSIKLTIELSERPMAGSRALVIGQLQSPLDPWIEASKRPQKEGKLDPPIKVTGADEGSALKGL